MFFFRFVLVLLLFAAVVARNYNPETTSTTKANSPLLVVHATTDSDQRLGHISTTLIFEVFSHEFESINSVSSFDIFWQAPRNATTRAELDDTTKIATVGNTTLSATTTITHSLTNLTIVPGKTEEVMVITSTSPETDELYFLTIRDFGVPVGVPTQVTQHQDTNEQPFDMSFSVGFRRARDEGLGRGDEVTGYGLFVGSQPTGKRLIATVFVDHLKGTEGSWVEVGFEVNLLRLQEGDEMLFVASMNTGFVSHNHTAVKLVDFGGIDSFVCVFATVVSVSAVLASLVSATTRVGGLAESEVTGNTISAVLVVDLCQGIVIGASLSTGTLSNRYRHFSQSVRWATGQLCLRSLLFAKTDTGVDPVDTSQMNELMVDPGASQWEQLPRSMLLFTGGLSPEVLFQDLCVTFTLVFVAIIAVCVFMGALEKRDGMGDLSWRNKVIEVMKFLAGVVAVSSVYGLVSSAVLLMTKPHPSDLFPFAVLVVCVFGFGYPTVITAQYWLLHFEQVRENKEAKQFHEYTLSSTQEVTHCSNNPATPQERRLTSTNLIDSTAPNPPHHIPISHPQDNSTDNVWRLFVEQLAKREKLSVMGLIWDIEEGYGWYGVLCVWRRVLIAVLVPLLSGAAIAQAGVLLAIVTVALVFLLVLRPYHEGVKSLNFWLEVAGLVTIFFGCVRCIGSHQQASNFDEKISTTLIVLQIAVFVVVLVVKTWPVGWWVLGEMGCCCCEVYEDSDEEVSDGGDLNSEFSSVDAGSLNSSSDSQTTDQPHSGNHDEAQNLSPTPAGFQKNRRRSSVVSAPPSDGSGRELDSPPPPRPSQAPSLLHFALEKNSNTKHADEQQQQACSMPNTPTMSHRLHRRMFGLQRSASNKSDNSITSTRSVFSQKLQKPSNSPSVVKLSALGASVAMEEESDDEDRQQGASRNKERRHETSNKNNNLTILEDMLQELGSSNGEWALQRKNSIERMQMKRKQSVAKRRLLVNRSCDFDSPDSLV